MRSSRTAAPETPAAWPPVASTVVATCAFIATGAWLGAEWPRAEVAGAPFGVWCIAGAAAVAAYLRWRPGGDRGQGHSLLDQLDTVMAGAAPAAHRVLATCWRLTGRSPESLERLERQWCERLDRGRRPTMPLSITAHLPAQLAEVANTSGALPFAWHEPGGSPAIPPDATLHVENGVLRVCTPEADGHDAAWFDWSLPRPLSYTSVFPLRVDAARVTIGSPDELAPHDVPVLRALVDAAAALARSPARLTLEDRLRGRRPQPASEGALGRSWVDAAMTRLSTCCLGEGSECVRRPALRAASAWLSTCEHADPDLRARAASAAVEALTGEPEPLLRLGAARFALLDDAGGLEAVLRADALIRAGSPEPIVDHLAFLQSEVELGLPTPTTLGRVAAGIALVCACSPADRLPFLRDDILDDLRFSGWLVGRDQDRAVLLEVFRVLEKARSKRARAAA